MVADTKYLCLTMETNSLTDIQLQFRMNLFQKESRHLKEIKMLLHKVQIMCCGEV